MEPVHIAIFASGSGTNAENIVKYFRSNKNIIVKLILCNNPDAFVITRAKNLSVESIVFNKKDFTESEKVINILKENNISWIILAGFLWLLPKNIVEVFSGRIINIHPALLPKYGGKGMYGMHVHNAVLNNKEKESGITIHYVNNEYDRGEIIFQAKCPVDQCDTPETLAKKVHQLEYSFFPRVVEEEIMKTQIK